MYVRNLYLAAGVLLALSGCATTKVDEQVDREAKLQPPRAMHGEVAGKGFQTLEASTSLRAPEKKKLLDLHARMASETFEIQDEISRLKGVLFETIASTPYDPEKVASLKKKLTALNDKKMENMFTALDEVEKILGQVDSAKERRELLRELMWERTMTRTMGRP